MKFLRKLGVVIVLLFPIAANADLIYEFVIGAGLANVHCDPVTECTGVAGSWTFSDTAFDDSFAKYSEGEILGFSFQGNGQSWSLSDYDSTGEISLANLWIAHTFLTDLEPPGVVHNWTEASLVNPPGISSRNLLFTNAGGFRAGLSHTGGYAVLPNISGSGAQAFVKGEFYLVRVPEPGTLALFGIGLAALGIAARRKIQP